MGCGGSTPQAPPPANKFVELGALTLGTPPPADLVPALTKQITEAFGSSGDHPVEKLDGIDGAPANLSFKIKEMQFVLSPTDVDSLCSADNAVAASGGGVPKSLFTHCIKAFGDGDKLVEFIFKAVVAMILEALKEERA